jgi:Na+-driven multidrug efflux pump
LDPRTKLLIEAPIAPTLLRLAIPNVITTVVQASTGLVETYFIGKLGTDALAGVALVFPGVMRERWAPAAARTPMPPSSTR